jgi:hypothetical protein
MCWTRSSFQILGKGTKTQNRKQTETKDTIYSENITYHLDMNFRTFSPLYRNED